MYDLFVEEWEIDVTVELAQMSTIARNANVI